MASVLRSRLQRELKELQRDPEPDISLEMDEENLEEDWRAVIVGPTETPYEGKIPPPTSFVRGVFPQHVQRAPGLFRVLTTSCHFESGGMRLQSFVPMLSHNTNTTSTCFINWINPLHPPQVVISSCGLRFRRIIPCPHRKSGSERGYFTPMSTMTRGNCVSTS